METLEQNLMQSSDAVSDRANAFSASVTDRGTPPVEGNCAPDRRHYEDFEAHIREIERHRQETDPTKE
jgi:hypothetical protein